MNPIAMIISIGTELTEGQIINRNAATLSHSLTELGFKVIRHETVSDSKEDMLASFSRAEKECDLVILTGGLGPTTDDFTRNVLSHFTGKELEWNEDAWKKIEERLNSRGIPVAESNRTQAYFPHGSKRLENLNGTADGFILVKSDLKKTVFIALPGPPREIEYIWKRHVEEYLELNFNNLTPRTLFTWRCLGVSESLLGEIVERALKKYPYERGYRASMPYVEVKLWLTHSELQSKESTYARAELDQALSPYCVSKNDGDLVEAFLSTLHNYYVEEIERIQIAKTRVLILDLGSEGLLTERLLSKLKLKKWNTLKKRIEFLTRFSDPTELENFPEPGEYEIYFGLLTGGEFVATGVNGSREKKSMKCENPYRSPELKDRELAFFTEKAIQFFSAAMI